MKKLFTLCVIIAMTISVTAQSPQKMSYQAVVRNTSGVLQANQAVGMRISILQGSETGTAVYVETQTKTTNANGLVTLEIGSGTIVSGTFSGIDWSNGTYFIKTETDPTGGTNFTITGTNQILSVPYALYAKYAQIANDTVNQANIDAIVQYINGLKNFMDAIMPPPTSGLVAYYPFNGNATDMSGNNMNGTVNGAILTVDRNGSPNKAYSFNKTKITVADNPLLDFTNSFSLCAWFKSNNKPDSLVQGIIGKSRPDGGTGYAMSLANPGNLFGVQPNFPAIGVGINNGSTGENVSYHSDSLVLGWHFVVGTYDGSQLKLYVDGKLKDTKPVSLTLQNSSRPLYIGRECGSVDGPTPPGDTVRYFYGKIDNVRLYNRPLNETEILTLYIESNILQPNYVPYVNDIDGNSYNTVKIGSQIWMAENLKATKYNDGSSIPFVTDGPTWSELNGPAYCWYNNEPGYKDIYGTLYNWYTVDIISNGNKNICPIYWHIPTTSEWQILINFLGGEGVALSDKLRETGTIHWSPPNTGATNESGFTALPGGRRDNYGEYAGIHNGANWWSTSEWDIDNAWMIIISTGAGLQGNFKTLGNYIRCIKD